VVTRVIKQSWSSVATMKIEGGVLTLCERCDLRWSVGFALAMASLALPLAQPTPHAFRARGAPHALHPHSIFVGHTIAFVAYIDGVRRTVRIRPMGDDGIIGFGRIHPEVKAEILEPGEEA
jgi:hypothetical protein